AAAGEQMRREGVAERVRAHLSVEADRCGVSLDDLVKPLAGERAAAEVDEELRLEPRADELGSAASHIALDRARGLAAERHRTVLRALAVRAQEAAADVDVSDLQPDRLGRAQPASVHDLEQRAVAQRDLVAARHALAQPL